MDMSTRYVTSVLAVGLVGVLGAMIMNAPSVWAVKRTDFTFYLHDDLLTATNPSAFAVVQPQPFGLIPPNQSFFGAVIVFDDSMTTGPDPHSLEIGRGRGVYVFDANDQKGAAIEFLWTAEFNAASGYGAGSTLTFKGFDRTTNPKREIAVTGGTGKFRLARGWAVITTYSLVGIGAANLKIDVRNRVLWSLIFVLGSRLFAVEVNKRDTGDQLALAVAYARGERIRSWSVW